MELNGLPAALEQLKALALTNYGHFTSMLVNGGLINQALDEPVTREPLTLSDLSSMEAAFATNAASGIRAVASVDDTEWPTDHKEIRRLSELYLDIPAERV